MTSRLEYHICVRHSIPASVALFSLSLLALPVLFVSSSQAQINGVPSSVTSPGFGSRPVNGAPASVTSLGPNGYAPRQGVTFSTSVLDRDHDAGRHHHHNYEGPAYYPYAYAVPVPYAADANQPDDADAEDETGYQGGPTVFDRRGSGAESYVPPVRDAPAPHSAPRADAEPPAPQTPQPLTLLVFKDGQKLEVGNYAIVGSTLFDLTPGHPRKIMLADLDLGATQKQNEDHGVTFQLPSPPQAN